MKTLWQSVKHHTNVRIPSFSKVYLRSPNCKVVCDACLWQAILGRVSILDPLLHLPVIQHLPGASHTLLAPGLRWILTAITDFLAPLLCSTLNHPRHCCYWHHSKTDLFILIFKIKLSWTSLCLLHQVQLFLGRQSRPFSNLICSSPPGPKF